jgi:hypothetical protein
MHNDLWLWDNPTLIMGLPVGLFYHVLYCFAASILLFLLIKFAWPDFVDEVNDEASDVKTDPDQLHRSER